MEPDQTSVRRYRQGLLHPLAKALLWWRLVVTPLTLVAVTVVVGLDITEFRGTPIARNFGPWPSIGLALSGAISLALIRQAWILLRSRDSIDEAAGLEKLLFWLAVVGCFIDVEGDSIQFGIGFNTSVIAHWLMMSHLDAVKKRWRKKGE